uniref:G-protein coupled receptors family 1 profile domain-containing protein n=1 Tax=Strigamia maritima TaxID=126957 RepID=T1J2N5_STRMM
MTDPTLVFQDLNETQLAVGVKLDIPYVVAEVLVAVMAVAGNLLVIVAFAVDRRLQRLTNYYIVSLAIADFLVGLMGIPFAVLTSVGLPHNSFIACLFMLSVLVVLCTISIFNLVAVSVDRFWAILFPLNYASHMSKRAAQGIIIVCWILGALIGFLPVIGWHQHPTSTDSCLFVFVMDYNFLVFLYFATIVGPSLLMGIFYGRIYCVVVQQVRQISALQRGPSSITMSALQNGGRTNPKVASRRDVKAAKNLFIIVTFFVFCWIPLYTINCVQAFCRSCWVPMELMSFTIVLSHANSACNPLVYAWHLKDFREAMRRCLCGKRPLASAALAGATGSLPTLACSYPTARTMSLPATPVQMITTKS